MGMTKCGYCWGSVYVLCVCVEWIGWKKVVCLMCAEPQLFHKVAVPTQSAC